MTPQTRDVPSQRVPTESGTPLSGGRTDDLSSASTGELVQRLSAQLSELVRRELDLARTELATKGKRAGAGAGLAGAGGVVALYGVGALIASAIAGLATVRPGVAVGADRRRRVAAGGRGARPRRAQQAPGGHTSGA